MLSRLIQMLLALASFVLVAFGQPAWEWWVGSISAAVGYALFFRILLDYPRPRHRFFLGMSWFAAVQLVQLSWFISHPYSYIYAIYILFALLLGIQFGILCIFITPISIKRFSSLLGIAALWTVFEWTRFFFFSGFSWNPAGLALTGNIYSLQPASLFGVFGLSFWVIFTNLLALRAFLQTTVLSVALWIAAVVAPYVYGAIQLKIHQEAMVHEQTPPLRALLVQTAFFPEEAIAFKDYQSMTAHLLDEWKLILRTMAPHRGDKLDLIVLPEYLLPGGTYSFLYPYKAVQEAFREVFGEESLKHLPIAEEPLMRNSLVNNAFWAQGLANLFQSGLVVGLEDAEDMVSGEREHYSSAVYFQPSDPTVSLKDPPGRYDKRVLLPMGEYIPFDWCRALAIQYGITGSFTPGKEAKVFTTHVHPFGLSICYEETFGHLMRENRLLGANFLVNLTSDVWYPHSRLPLQHLAHAYLRTVENGMPLLRASNMGITGAWDSLGNLVAMVEKEGKPDETLFKALRVDVSSYNYQTVYTHFGDYLILGLCVLFIVGALILPQRH